MTRREAALAAATKLGKPTAETRKAIEENRAFYEQRRAERAAAAVEPIERRALEVNGRRASDRYVGQERRVANRRAVALLPHSLLDPEPAVKAAIDARAASGDQKRFTGELPSGFGDFDSFAFA